MPQLSKLIKARDKWREKATKRAEELWENRKIVKYEVPQQIKHLRKQHYNTPMK